MPSTTAAPPRRWLDRHEAADYLGVSLRWMKRSIDEGRLPRHKMGRLVRFDVRDLDAFIEAGRIEADTHSGARG